MTTAGELFTLLIVLVFALRGALATTKKCPTGYDYVRDKHDCTKFYHCLEGAVIRENNCPEGLVFSNQARVCDWPENVPECYNYKSQKIKTKHKKKKPTVTHELDNEISGSATAWTEPPTSSTKAAWEIEWSPSIGPTTAAEPPPAGGLSDNYKIVCYFSNWAWYRPDAGRFIPEDINPYLCTHINYAFAVLDSESLTIKIHDSWADVDNRFMKRIVGLREKNPKLKVSLALGGWNDRYFV